MHRQDQRWLVSTPTSLSVPETVKDVIRRRVTALSTAARSRSRLAAVVGRDFDLEILEAVTGLPDHQLIDSLEEAVRARFVEETGTGRFRFAHASVRAALAEEVSHVRRMRLHHAIGTALERVRATDLASLAHHFAEAGTGAATVIVPSSTASPPQDRRWRRARSPTPKGATAPYWTSLTHSEPSTNASAWRRCAGSAKPSVTRATVSSATRFSLRLDAPAIPLRPLSAHASGSGELPRPSERDRSDRLGPR